MEKPRIEYIRMDEFIDRFHPQNPKDHDIGALISSLQRFGFVENPTIDEKTGFCVAGHGRTIAANAMREQMRYTDVDLQKHSGLYKHDSGVILPTRLDIDTTDGMWMIPVVRGITFRDQAHVNAYLVASNRLVMLGGWEMDKLAEILQNIQDSDDGELLQATGYDEEDLGDMLQMLAPPDLDVLESEYGEPDPETFWPILRAKIEPLLYEQFMDIAPGETDDERVTWLIQQVIE